MAENKKSDNKPNRNGAPKGEAFVQKSAPKSKNKK